MTLPNSRSLIVHDGNAAATSFSYDFIVPTTADLIVSLYNIDTRVTTVLSPGEYSVTGIGNPSGGAVTYPLVGAPLPVGMRLIIQRNVPYSQDLNISNQGGFNPITLMNQLDRIVMQIQQLREITERSIQLVPGDDENFEQLVNEIFAAANAAEEAAEDAQEWAQQASLGTFQAGQEIIGSGGAVSFDTGFEIGLAARLLWWRNGVRQALDAWTFSGSEVTPNTPLEEGDYVAWVLIGSVGSGWSPIFGAVPRDDDIVLKIVDWADGTGAKPPVGDYIGPNGLTPDIAEATALPDGPPGPPNSLTIGTVQTAVTADASITGTAPNQTLNLDLPQGDPWDQWIDTGWLTATEYTRLDALAHNGSSYICTADHTSGSDTEPGVGVDWATVWDLIAAKGADGLGTGDVTGPAGAVAGNVPALDATGKVLSDSGIASNDILVAGDIGSAVQAYDAATAKLDVENQTLTGGVAVTSKDLGTQSGGTLTLDVGDRPLQHCINGGAFTLAPGSVAGACLLDIVNNGSAGAITVSGWDHVAGDAFTTTDTHAFRCHASVGQNGSLLIVQALQ